MGKSTISMAIFNSYFVITRGYIIKSSTMTAQVIPSPLGGLVKKLSTSGDEGNFSMREIQSKQLETTLKKRLSMAFKSHLAGCSMFSPHLFYDLYEC